MEPHAFLATTLEFHATSKLRYASGLIGRLLKSSFPPANSGQAGSFHCTLQNITGLYAYGRAGVYKRWSEGLTRLCDR